MCTVVLPPGDNPTAVDKYIIYHIALIEGHSLRMIQKLVPKAMLGFKRMEEREAG